MDALHTYIDEPQLGLAPTGLEELLGVLRHLEFEIGFKGIAWVIRRLSPIQRDPTAQLFLARQIFRQHEFVPQRLARIVAKHPSRVVFAESLLVPLLRLMIEESPNEDVLGDGALTDACFERLILGAPSALERWTRKDFAANEPGVLLGFFMQKANFLRDAPTIPELARPLELFRLMSLPQEGRVERDRCYPEQAMAETYGFTSHEQMRLGFALAATLKLWDHDRDGASVFRVPEGNFRSLLSQLGFSSRLDQALSLLSATRVEFREDFNRTDSDRSNLAGNLVPFQRRPFLRGDDGSLVLTSPRFLTDWLTEGFHFRALDAIAGNPRDRRRSGRYLRYSGHIFERYCVELAQEAHRVGFLRSAEPVSGDVSFRTKKGEKRSVDLVVNSGQDLVICEIEHHRPSMAVSVEGSPAASERNLEDHVLGMIGGLRRFIEALRDPRLEIPIAGLDMTKIRRIWPVVVGIDVPAQQPPFWDYLERGELGALRALGAEPLTVLDADDFEMVCGIVEGGMPLPQILALKCTPPFATFELSVWLRNDPRAPAMRRPGRSELAFKRITDDLADTFIGPRRLSA